MKSEIKQRRIRLFLYFLLSIVIGVIGVGIIGVPLFIIQHSNSDTRFLETTIPVFVVLVVSCYWFFSSRKPKTALNSKITPKKYILLKALASLLLVGMSIWLSMNNYRYDIIPLSLILLVMWWSDVPKIWKNN